MKRIRGIAAAGLFILGSASSAKAQFTLGYDSAYYNILPSAAYFTADGYDRIYTDIGTGIYAEGTSQPFRGVAPYSPPPFGEFSRSDSIGDYRPGVGRPRPAAVKNAPAARPDRRRLPIKAR